MEPAGESLHWRFNSNSLVIIPGVFLDMANEMMMINDEDPEEDDMPFLILTVWGLSHPCRIYRKYVEIDLKNWEVIGKANTVFG
jgi:hypothetical protein